MTSLAGKIALVVGGGTGIGRAIALAFAAEGSRVVVAGRREDKLHEVVAMGSNPSPIFAHPVDVVDRASVSALVDWTNLTLGQIDILVNAAGMNIPDRSMEDLPPETWDEVLSINATGAYNCIRAVLPQMRSRQAGLIINISSVAGKRASKLAGVAYSASKFAMTALGMTVGLEEGKNGIRVTNVYPGETDTLMLDKRPQPLSREHRARILQPETVAEMIVAVAKLPPLAHVPELVIKPVWHDYA
jgi:NAD(P)-dependent dehydrogenase (short-subunit alcohol dehydrogenase family)